MARKLRIWVALSENPSSIPSTYNSSSQPSVTSIPKGMFPCSDLQGSAQTCIQPDAYTYKIKINYFLNYFPFKINVD